MNNIPFREFINTYNFRYMNDLESNFNEDTQIIRIYLPRDEVNKSDWFEFGMYDFGTYSYKQEMIESIFSKEILDSFVDGISFNQDYEKVVSIYLTKQKNTNYD